MSLNTSKVKKQLRKELLKFDAMQETGDNLIAKQLAIDLCVFLHTTGNDIPEWAQDWWHRNKPKQLPPGPVPTVCEPPPTSPILIQ